jgi:hypothetical protein
MHTMPTPLNIPSCLEEEVKQLRWVLWNWVKAADGRLTKPPYRVDNPTVYAKPNDPTTWACGMAALKAYALGVADGIGYALMNSGIGAVDLDDCRDPKTGELAPWAQQLLEKCGTYAEVTPSGCGLRIIGKVNGGTLHRKFAAPDGGSVEVYRNNCARYICITGHSLTPAVERLGNIDALLDGIVAEFGKKPQAKMVFDVGGGQQRELPSLDEIIKRGCFELWGNDRSKAEWYVVNQLIRQSKSDDEIVAIFTDVNNTISAHCLSKPENPRQYILRTIGRARQQQAAKAKPAADGSPDDVGIEISRLAELNEVEYERERKTAAERLGVRAQILDRLVAAERTRLEGESEGGGKKGQGQAIKLIEPEPWDDAVNGAELLNAIAKTISDYVIFGNEHAARAIATWIAFTYTVDSFMFAPRLCITSPILRCGKTTLLDVISCMAQRSLLTSNVSPAALFRVIEKYQPCILIDEGDTFLDLSEELRGVLNGGHRKGQGVLRIVGDDLEPKLFKTFSACAIALIGLPPATVTDRSIMVELHRKRPGDKTTPFRLDRIEPLKTLARQAARWVRDNAIEIGATEAELPPEIYNRAADNWRIMKKIAIVAGDPWPGYIDSAARAAATIGEDQELLVALLAHIRDIEFVYVIAGEDNNKPEYEAEGEIPSAILVQKLIELQGGPWAEMPDKRGREGKPLSQNKLARMLKPLAISPEQIGPKRVSGYRRAHFAEAFERYLADQGGSQPLNPSKRDEQGTSCISQPLMTETEREVGKCEKPNNDGQKRTREVANGGNGALAQEVKATGGTEVERELPETLDAAQEQYRRAKQEAAP